MNVTAVDRRVQRTRQLLNQALMRLIVEKGYEAIRVQDIVSEAHVGRSTFYNHFKEKDELLRAGLEDLRLQLRSCRDQATQLPGPIVLRFARCLIDHAHEQRFVLRAVLGKPSGLAVEAGLRQLLWELIRDELMDATGRQLTPELEATSHYLGGALMDLLRWWVETRNPIEAHELEALFHQLTAPALSAVFGAESGKALGIG